MYLLVYDIFRSFSDAPRIVEEQINSYDDLCLKIKSISCFATNLEFNNGTLRYFLPSQNNEELFGLVYRWNPKFGNDFYKSNYYHIKPFKSSVIILPKKEVKTFQETFNSYITKNKIKLSAAIEDLLKETFDAFTDMDFVNDVVFSSYVYETLQESTNFNDSEKEGILDEFYEFLEKNEFSRVFEHLSQQNQDFIDFNRKMENNMEIEKKEKLLYDKERNILKAIEFKTMMYFKNTLSQMKRGERVADEELLKRAKNMF